MRKQGNLVESKEISPNNNHTKKQENSLDRNITFERMFYKLCIKNNTVKNVEKVNQLKEGAKLIQQKGSPIPIHLQPAVETKLKY